jgi:hypothetical protein
MKKEIDIKMILRGIMHERFQALIAVNAKIPGCDAV